MKIKLSILCVVLVSILSARLQNCFAASINLSWYPSTSPTITGYKVYYGTAPHTYVSPMNAGKLTSFSISGLPAGTYYFAITAYDSSGAESGYSNEVTATVTNPAPVISSVKTPVLSSTTASVSWITDIPSDSQVVYGLTTAYNFSTALNTTPVTSHSQTLAGLSAGTTYHYQVKSKSSAGVLSTSADYTFTTVPGTTTTTTTTTTTPTTSTGPLTISKVSTSGITKYTVTINWATNVPANSTVQYGLRNTYGSSVTQSTMVNQHSITLSGLFRITTYHYRVLSKDAYGKVVASPDYTFTTAF